MIRSSWIFDSCSVCLRFRIPPLWPAVELTLENKFNDIVCLDLKEYGHDQYWILHLIDTFTSYSAARQIKTERSKEIICNIFFIWISYFGPPKHFWSDNGGEFNNEGYQEMNEKLNIETCTTTVESSFSNGTVQCYNLIVAESMEKTLEDEKCESEIALALAVCAKNTFQNHLGHNLNKLVFGFNINTLSVLTDQLPTLEAAINLKPLHGVRKCIIEAELS